MNRIFLLIFIGFFISGNCFSQAVTNVSVTIEVTNIAISDGNIHLNIFSNAQNFKNEKPDFTFILEAGNSIITQEVTVSTGEYLISVFQDSNNNGKLDIGLFSIPKEPVGISNYYGKGYPSNNFDKQKILIGNTTGKITIELYKF